MINFIDVLLVLLIFFMVSTTFNQEGRVKVQLPQASAIPQPRGNARAAGHHGDGGGRLSGQRAAAHQLEPRYAAGRAARRRPARTAGRSPSARTRAARTRRWSPRWTSRADSVSPSSTSRPCTRMPRLDRGRRRDRRALQPRRRLLVDLPPAAAVREALHRRVPDRRARHDPVRRDAMRRWPTWSRNS